MKLGSPFSYQGSFLSPDWNFYSNQSKPNNTHMEFTVYLLFPFAGTDDAISSYIKSITDDYKLEFLKNLQLYQEY